MKVKFKNPYSGVGGPVEKICPTVLYVASTLKGRSMDLSNALLTIARCVPDDYWVRVDEKNGWINVMRRPHDPSLDVSRWRLIDFERVSP